MIFKTNGYKVIIQFSFLELLSAIGETTALEALTQIPVPAFKL